MTRSILLAGLAFFSVSLSHAVHAQEKIKLSGLAFADYEYLLASPVEGEEGQNGFGYRRLYLTTDFTLSEAFSGRARLEANDADPHPFVKDLYLKWSISQGAGHQLIIGVSPPPVFAISEEVWGYRSLEKTILDRNGVVSSRDMGVAARGPITSGGALQYGLMVANNSGVRAETDKYKRVYGQLVWYPAKPLTLTLGGDYAGYGDERTDGTTLHAFAGYQTRPFRVGIEGFVNRIHLAAAETGADTNDLAGITVFAAVRLGKAWEVVARFDQVERDLGGIETGESFFMAGLAYQPHTNVRFIPNVLVSQEREDEQALVNGRITLEVRF